MLIYRKQLLMIMVLMVFLMSLGVYTAGYNMKRNTLESVPDMFSWEKNENVFSIQILGLDISSADGVNFLNKIKNIQGELVTRTKPVLMEISGRAGEYRQKVQTVFDGLMGKIYSCIP